MTTTTTMTFGEAVERYLTRTEDRGREPATIKSYRYMSRRFLVPLLGHKDVRALKPMDFDALGIVMKREMGLKTQTIGKAVTLAGAVLQYAMRNEWCDRNPARLAELPRRDPVERDVPELADLVRFLEVAAVVDPDVYDYAWVIANTGARCGEVMAFMQTDIDADGILTIERAVDVSHSTVRIKGTKTGETRFVPLDDTTIALIRARGGPYVFGGQTAGRTDLWGKRFAKVRKAAGTTFPARCLRHFHGTVQCAEGGSSKQVSVRLGHANDHVTQSTYIDRKKLVDRGLRGVVADAITRARTEDAA